MNHRTLARGGFATALAIASVALVPGAAMAKDAGANAKKNKNNEATQNFNIRRNTRTNNRQRRQIAEVTNSLGDAIAKLNDLDTTFQGLVPVVTKALGDLQTGLTTVGAGLTTAAEKLTTLGSAYQAVEFGVTRVRIGTTGLAPFSAVSPDIPDDGNRATASGEVPIPVLPSSGGGAADPTQGQVPADTLLSPRSAIRSAESDGVAGGPPAGYVGGLMFITCGGTLGGATGIQGNNCALPAAAGGGTVPPGAVMCSYGPTPNATIPGFGPQSLAEIPTKASRTDQTVPNGSSVNPIAGAQPAGPLAAGAGTDGCMSGPAGNLLLVNIQTQFVDLPTSATPGPTE
jgi:hypothetical protein